MKQVLLDRASGNVLVAEVPDAVPQPGRVLVRNEASVISAGTEGAQVASESRTLVQRIMDKPDLVKKGLATLRTQGLSAARDKLSARLSGFSPLGYSCAGIVVATGADVEGLSVGQRVACGGAGYANHAERVSVPARLCAVAPPGVGPEAAAYTTVGAIAMQGVRQAGVALGECVAVIGLGLVGLLTAQLLKAAGCIVLGVDRVESARTRGLSCGCADAATPESAGAAAARLSRGIGADAVIVCAAAADSAPVELAAQLARSRGRIVMVGATGMTIPREIFYNKELSLVLSRSYGPGRYDPAYEEGGHDYPVDYVRFTEQRNMQAFLDMAANGAINPALLTTHRFPLDEAPAAYDLLKNPASDRAGVLLTYPEPKQGSTQKRVAVSLHIRAESTGTIGIGFIGAGDYATQVLLPLLSKQEGIQLRGVAARTGSRSLSAAKRFGFAFAASDAHEVLKDDACRAVFIVTRHASHASLVVEALNEGKHVWVEKPLALTVDELKQVEEALRAHPELAFTVGFNRRFSPLSQWIKSSFPNSEPLMMHYRVNAGHLPATHWTQDRAEGGGRLMGEGCHFFDYLCFMAGSDPVRVSANAVQSERADLPASSNFSAQITFRNGSVGHLLYTAMGSPQLPKERVEVFAGGRCAALDDFQRATICHVDRAEEKSLRRQDKGQAQHMAAFLAALRFGADLPIPRDDILRSSLLTLAAQQSLERRQPVALDELS